MKKDGENDSNETTLVHCRRPPVHGFRERTGPSEDLSRERIAWDIIENMRDDFLYVIGQGKISRIIAKKLGLGEIHPGIDVYDKGKNVASDAGTTEVIDLIKKKKAKLLIELSGGLGLLSDTGGRSISPEIIREIGRENIVTMATPDELASLNGSPLIVDSSDVAVDEMLSGYHNVITGYRKRAVYKLVSRSRESSEPEIREINKTRY